MAVVYLDLAGGGCVSKDPLSCKAGGTMRQARGCVALSCVDSRGGGGVAGGEGAGMQEQPGMKALG